MAHLSYNPDPGLDTRVDSLLRGSTFSFEISKLDRRGFLKLTGIAGGGLMLCLNARVASAAKPEPPLSAVAEPFQPGAFVQISSREIVILACNPEVGQGVKTSLPMMVAEELDAAWEDVRVVQAPVDAKRYGPQFAAGSNSTPNRWDGMRQAGAVARAMLVATAAQRWGIAAGDCRTRDSHVLHPDGKLRLSYLELAEGAAKQAVPEPSSLQLKSAAEYRLLGQRVSGVDNLALVTGQPLFGVDHKVPGMLYAAYQKAPATGGIVASANLDEIRQLAGVVDAFILEGNGEVAELMPGVAIVASDTSSAFRAKRALRVEWDRSGAAQDSWDASIDEARRRAKGKPDKVFTAQGDVDAALAAAAQIVEGEYTYHFLTHAQLEPQNCTASYTDGSVELWSGSQTPDNAIDAVARTLGIPRKTVTFHQLRGGGGFGRRLVNDPVCEAAAISKHIGKPVKLTWTREDDMQHDFFRAGGHHKLKGAVDAEGRLSAWQSHFVSFTHDGEKPVTGGVLFPGMFPEGMVQNLHVAQTLLPWHTPCGAWRAPGASAYGFVEQCFLHELAVASGRDHRAFLLEVFGEPRQLAPGQHDFYPWGRGRALHTGRAAAVVERATEAAGWGRTLPEGRGLGLAFYFSHRGYFAEVAEVSVSPEKRLTVHKVTVVGDIGQIVNLSGAENQVEGSVIDGLSAMLAQKVTHEGGSVKQDNFHRYPLLRMPHAPEVEVHFLDSGYGPTGAGEPALPPLAPAVCNAIYAVNGHRIRTLPISEEGYTI